MPVENKDFVSAIEAVLLAFGAVIAVALERFYSEPVLVDNQRFNSRQKLLRFLPARGVFYWSALTVLVSLSVRFLIGSSVHMHHNDSTVPESLRDSLWYTLWLFIFGSIIVRASSEETVRGFAKWLMYFSIGGVVWSLIAIFSPADNSNILTVRLAEGWFWINLVQLICTAVLWWVSDGTKRGRNSQVWWLLGIAIVFGMLFIVDVCNILRSPSESILRCILRVLRFG